jgi:hypothetical protein
MRLRLRRRKPLPVRPVPPLKAENPDAKFADAMESATLALARAIRDYAQAPDEIPATIRADYATNVAFGALVNLLAGVHAKLQPGELLHVEHKQRVLYALVVSHGIQDLLSTTVDVAECWGKDKRAAVHDWAELIWLWTRDAADLVQADVD